MSLTITMPYSLKSNLLKRLISDLSSTSSDIKVALVTALPNATTVDNYSEITELDPNGANGVGYTLGGQALTSKTVSLTAGTAMFDADDAVWSTSSITAIGAVIYDNTPAEAANKKILAIIDFDGSKSSSSGTFKLQWNASGILTLS